MVGSNKFEARDLARASDPFRLRNLLITVLEGVAILCAACVMFWAIDSLDMTAVRNLPHPFSGTQPR